MRSESIEIIGAIVGGIVIELYKSAKPANQLMVKDERRILRCR